VCENETQSIFDVIHKHTDLGCIDAYSHNSGKLRIRLPACLTEPKSDEHKCPDENTDISDTGGSLARVGTAQGP
jgi:hypothetical protein